MSLGLWFFIGGGEKEKEGKEEKEGRRREREGRKRKERRTKGGEITQNSKKLNNKKTPPQKNFNRQLGQPPPGRSLRYAQPEDLGGLEHQDRLDPVLGWRRRTGATGKK